ncbi:MAG: hypothetical protein E2P02_29730 [Acidobacteria bacterium]|nr:MAG: hypothetical protein E2P02_29730 [Acidobacteriota bacterium]
MRGVGLSFSSLFMFTVAVRLLAAQYQGMEPVRVSVDELASMGTRYNDRPVITKGKVKYGDMEDQQYNIFELEGEMLLTTIRIGTGGRGFEDLRFMTGQEVEVSGIFFDMSSVVQPQYHPILRYYPGAKRQDGAGFNKDYFLAVSTVDVIVPIENPMDPDKPEEQPDIVDPDIDVSGVNDVDLRDLVKDPANYVGKQIVVYGKFRGNNLYGDLSIKDKRTPRDFIIKLADAAIWVTGRRPRGDGFRLDPKKRRDTGKWLNVIGTAWQHEGSGTYYLRAEKIELADKPEEKDLEPAKVVKPEEEKLGPPPEVAFSLPLPGERDIPLDSEFHIQFSNPMKAETFNRNVDLLYADDDGIGNPFPELEVSYDRDSRTLTVKPNKQLEPSKEIELILYDAIEDEDGQKILAEPGAADREAGAAVIISFRTARR